MSENEKLAFIIEDDYDASVIFSKALEVNGVKTETIKSGDLALKRLSETVPDLVLLDLHLPEVGGAKVLAHIRADERLREIPVIVITADPGLAETIRQETELVLLKPTTFSQVRSFTSRILTRGVKHI